MDSKKILNKVKGHTPSILGNENFSKFAILLPLIQVDNEVHILFEVRSQELRRQPGEICFPGGRIDPQDKTEKDAALRETGEELGISAEDVTDVFPLDFLVSPFGMIVYPFVGFINSPESINPNPSEVGGIFSVPLSFFLETKPQIYHVNVNMQPEENFPFDLIAGGQNYNWRTREMDEYFYKYEDKVIWGLTAKILSHFVEVVR
ncbi:NUDIX hydrolase [Bacillus sp. DJP31]|uniref:NUDIX hydrolase n=1 Tax=Bacillus sp. DJP31 TaxID=3409789 RepID=UPI003BB79357